MVSATLEEDLTQLPRAELQRRCKALGIKANSKTVVLIEKLTEATMNAVHENDSETEPVEETEVEGEAIYNSPEKVDNNDATMMLPHWKGLLGAAVGLAYVSVSRNPEIFQDMQKYLQKSWKNYN